MCVDACVFVNLDYITKCPCPPKFKNNIFGYGQLIFSEKDTLLPSFM